jgi:hypothetical protein
MFVACDGGGGGDTPAPSQKTTYEGKIYMASTNGGHIAVVPVTIDPTNAAAPIALGTLSTISLGPSATHNFHDVRLDGTKLFYSAIKVDSTATADAGKIHLGYVDLADSNPATRVKDAVLDAAPGSTAMVYCGSGQTATHFVPMTMSHPAYIDAIAKSALTDGATLASGSDDVKRTFVEAFRANSDYIFAHGVNNNGKDELFVAVNETSAGAGGTPAGMSGAVTAYRLKMSDVVAGTVTGASVLASSTFSGLSAGGATIAFRSTYTPDGTKILQAGKDRLLVLDPNNLAVLDNNTSIGGSFVGVENHDVMPTPDGKYAILALRFKYSATGKVDSGLQLYDLTTKTAVGAPVSACNACHSPSNPSGVISDRATCGLDGALTTVIR